MMAKQEQNVKPQGGLKQRIIGALVLVSLLVIFIPVIFDPTLRHEVDTRSLVPQAPGIKQRRVAQPVIPDVPAAKSSADEMYAGVEVVNNSVSDKSTGAKTAPSTKTSISKKPPKILNEMLDAKGLPQSWFLQLASFTSVERAKSLESKLLDAGYHAYWKGVKDAKSSGSKHYRVYVGPNLEKAAILKIKAKLEKQFKSLKLKPILLRYKA